MGSRSPAIGDQRAQVHFQMNNRFLTPAICQFWMISSVQDVEHDRPGTEIERDEIANLCARYATDFEFLPASFLDRIQPNESAVEAPNQSLRIGAYAAFGNHLRQIPNVGYVKY